MKERSAEHSAEQDPDRFTIYQIRPDSPAEIYEFMEMDLIRQKGYEIRPEDFQEVYTGSLIPGTTLEDLYVQFNGPKVPEDFTGHSLSVSDIVVLNLNGKLTSYYVEPVGFKEIPDFLPPENHLKNAEMAIEDDYDMIDGIINNGEKKSVREQMGEYRNMIEAYVHAVPKTVNKDRSDLEH